MNKREVPDLRNEKASPFFLQGGSHAILLLHGFTGTPAHMRPLGQQLNNAGYTVQGIALPGHGTMLEDMAAYKAQDYIQTVKTAVIALKESHDKVTVAGLSMGGVLTLIAAEQMPLMVDSIITFSAPMKTQNKLMPLAKLASPFMPFTYWNADPTREGLVDPEYDFGYQGFPTKSAYELHTLIRIARKNLFAVTCPTLIVQSHNDETISRDSLDIIAGHISSKQKAKLWLKDAPHVCTLSSELGDIVSAVTDFLAQAGK